MRARTPAAIISRASAAVSAPNSGNNGVKPVPARRSSRYRRTSSRKRSPNAIWVNPSATARSTAPPHGALVDVIRTRRRNRNLPQRQPERAGLRLEHVDTHRVHGDPLCRLVDRRQQAAELDTLLPQDMHRPGAVLAARPRHQRLHLKSSGCSVFASRSVATTTRGPGTTNSSPCSMKTLWFFTAGIAGSASHAAQVRRCGRVAAGVAQLDDHLRCTRQHRSRC